MFIVVCNNTNVSKLVFDYVAGWARPLPDGSVTVVPGKLGEQVVGRGLRRMSYAAQTKTIDMNGAAVEIMAFATEYAEVFGVPFSFIPTTATGTNPKPGPTPTRVRALEDRIALQITFPRVTGYRFVLPATRLSASFTDASKLTLSTADIPTRTENAPIVSESAIMSLDDLKRRREQEVAFLLAKLVLEKYFRAELSPETGLRNPLPTHRFDPDVQAWLFPQVQASDGEKTLLPILRPYDTIGSTRYVDFDTTRPTWKTDPRKCHISHVVADTDSWEQKMAQVLEGMPEAPMISST